MPEVWRIGSPGYQLASPAVVASPFPSGSAARTGPSGPMVPSRQLASARQRAFGGVTAALQPAVTASQLAAGQTVTIGGAQAPARRSTFRARPPA